MTDLYERARAALARQGIYDEVAVAKLVVAASKADKPLHYINASAHRRGIDAHRNALAQQRRIERQQAAEALRVATVTARERERERVENAIAEIIAVRPKQARNLRAVLEVAYDDGNGSYARYCARVGCSAETAYQHVSRGLKALAAHDDPFVREWAMSPDANFGRFRR